MTTCSVESAEAQVRPASWAAVVAVSAGAFAMVSAEFLPIGLLPAVAEDFGITEGHAGLMVTVPGVVAAVAAPVIAGTVGRLDRRWVLSALLLLLMLSNVAVATASSFTILLLGRVLLGIGVGGFWTVGGSLGPRLRPGADGTKATAIIFSGISLGTVAGLPSGSFLGSIMGWRLAFVATAGLALLAIIAVVVLLPQIRPQVGSGIKAVPQVLRFRLVQVALIAAIFCFAGHFGAYTYIAPFLNSASGTSPAALSAVLVAYGVTGFLGNIAGGWLAVRNVQAAPAVAAISVALAIAVLAATGSHPNFAIAAVMAWGLAFGMWPVAINTFVFSVAPQHLESATAVFQTIAQASIAVGALLGGVAVDSMGVASALWIGAIGAAVASAIIVFFGRSATRTASGPA